MKNSLAKWTMLICLGAAIQNAYAQVACPIGRVYVNGACVTCPAGQVKKPQDDQSTDAKCVPAKDGCGTNEYVSRGQCVKCGLGKVPNTDRTACAQCSDGKVKVPNVDWAADAECVAASKACGTNQIAKDGGCLNCRAGRIPSSRRTSCVACKSGYVKEPNVEWVADAKCVKASQGCGTNQIAVDSGCVNCPDPQVPSPDRLSCQTCPNGTAKVPASGDVRDAACRPARSGGCGTNQVARNGRCRPCGFNQIPVSDTECAVCPAGFVKHPNTDYSTNAICAPPRPCGSNQVALNGQCWPCPEGKVPIDAIRCGYCPDSTVKYPDNGWVTNALCIPGSRGCGTAMVAKLGRCIFCPRGQIRIADAVCDYCKPGSVKVPDDSQVYDAVCIPARMGGCGASAVAVNGTCVMCPSRQVAVNDTACDYCPSGQVKKPADWDPTSKCVTALEGCGTNQIAVLSECVGCPANMIPAANRTVCVNCPPNTTKAPNNAAARDAACWPNDARRRTLLV